MSSLFTREGLIMAILSLPAILIALSVHEAAHAFAANKLGDSTAKNLGRLTLNPIKHIDIFGFLCMLIAKIGWAKPVPINARNFKKPRRDMALSAAAGPISNLCLALIHFLLLLALMFFMKHSMTAELSNMYLSLFEIEVEISMLAKVLAVVAYILYIGIVLNISLAIFNMLPIPPFDGSRIAYVFLPTKIYFGIMKYELYIQLGVLALLWFGVLDAPLNWLFNTATNTLLLYCGMPLEVLTLILAYLTKVLFV